MSAQLQDCRLKQESFISVNGIDSNSVGYQGCKNNQAMLTLLENGMIISCNEGGGELLGCEPSNLKWQHISKLVPMLKEISLMLDRKINPYLKFLSIVGHRYEAVGMNEVCFSCELFYFIMDDPDRICLQTAMQPVRRQATLGH